MRIALVHDYIKEYGGAERVLETLHEMFPDAPVFTLVYCPEFLGPHKKRFANWTIKTSFLQYLPFKEKFISIYRLFAPFIFPLFHFSGYDVVIVSSTGAYSPNRITKGSAKQLCYCHTPPRYLYGYATAREWKKNPFIRVLAESLNTWLRGIDKASSHNVDQYIANSEEVKARIKRFYGKDAVVIYPPVDVAHQSLPQKRESGFPIRSGMTANYFLAGGRLARPKHYDLLMRACAQLDVPLTLFGKGFAGFERELRTLNKELGEKTVFVGEVSDTEKLALMSKAKAYLMASEDEDFGITPVEAMGVGTPVIAYKSGGLKETVVDGKTGIFFEKLTVADIVAAIKKFEALRLRSGKKLSGECIEQAKKFDRKHFEDHISSLLTHYA